MLEALGKTWSVASDARSKFDRLAEATEQSWRRMERSWHAQQGETQPDQSQHGLQSNTATEGGLSGNSWTNDGLDALFDPAEILADQLSDVNGWFDLDWFECGI